ncbi:c-type cytochrome biogenesis protein CcmI [Oricola thermophila]|uniref:C-type cytochrome biogenesis protein CcmI n=1 Tax=Oricola thermophila TaxID=2742145 RepID=A0A6N1VD34_9HYPH|nr:c-type cytochrome biogenesis protein CcmI [Oricola thermophila]QKV18618.1 c-type cytochrome biogenesis protein CcmI [Oricola thermophila]
MLFTLFAALLTLLLLALVFWPVARAPETAAADGHDFDVAIYKDQLRELEADIARGAIDPAEADYARAEIGRRLITAGEAAEAESRAAVKRRRSGIAMLVAAAVFVPFAAVIVYSLTGSPGMEAQPLAARLEERQPMASSQTIQGMDINELVARAEAHLNANPEDGRGWDVLAPMYLRLGRAADARNAFERAIALQGESAQRRSGLGQAYYMLAQGLVDANARAEFERALELDGGDSRSRFFLALSAAQAGDEGGAVAAWQAIVDDPGAAPEWKAAAAEGLRRFAAAAAEASAPRLDEETMRDAEQMSAGDREEMILGMIARLDERLRDNPDDVAGWQRLIRSYAVLGRADEATDALGRALDAFAEDADKHAEIAAFADALGLSSGEAAQ